MEQAFPALSRTLNSSMSLQHLTLSRQDYRRLEFAQIESLTFFEHLTKCSDSPTNAANTKCVLEAISQSSKCKLEYSGLVECAKKLAAAGPNNVRSSLKACRKPERELAQCVDGMVADLIGSLAGGLKEFVIFEQMEHIDD